MITMDENRNASVVPSALRISMTDGKHLGSHLCLGMAVNLV
jgi:hypothetical protein